MVMPVGIKYGAIWLKSWYKKYNRLYDLVLMMHSVMMYGTLV